MRKPARVSPHQGDEVGDEGSDESVSPHRGTWILSYRKWGIFEGLKAQE